MTHLISYHQVQSVHVKSTKSTLGVAKCNMKQYYLKEFVEACKKATGVDIKVEYFSRHPGDYAKIYSDSCKIRSDLGWSARYNLEESLSIA